MDLQTGLNIFLITGGVLLAVAAVMMVILIYRYITGMRRQGFFGGKKQDEKE